MIQPYENLNGRDHAEYPIVLHAEELGVIASFFASVDTSKPNLASIASFGGMPTSNG